MAAIALKHNKVRRLRRPGLAPYARLPANLWQDEGNGIHTRRQKI